MRMNVWYVWKFSTTVGQFCKLISVRLYACSRLQIISAEFVYFFFFTEKTEETDRWRRKGNTDRACYRSISEWTDRQTAMVASHAFLSLPRPPLQCSLSSKNLRMSSSMNLKSTATSVSLHNSRPLSVRAGSDVNKSNTSSSSSTTTTAKIRTTPASESSSSLQTVFVEDESVSVEGVAKVDRATNSSSNDSSWG